MSLKVLLDTNILIKLFRNEENKDIERKLFDVIEKDGQLFISSISEFELLKGWYRENSEKNLERKLKIMQFFGKFSLNPIEFNSRTADFSATLYCLMLSKGIEKNKIKEYDFLIGTTALFCGCLMFTDNKKDFEGIPSIEFFE